MLFAGISRRTLQESYAAFQDDKRYEISRILKKIAGDIEDGREYGSCMDICGNKIGSWEI